MVKQKGASSTDEAQTDDLPIFGNTEAAPAAENATPAYNGEPKPEAVEIITDEGEIKKDESLTALPSLFEGNSFADLLTKSKQLEEKKNVVSLTPSYFQFETQGTIVKGVFCGFTTISKKALDGSYTPIECATWMDNGKMFMAGGVALVDEFKRRHIAIGTSVQITYTGKNGNTKLFDLGVIY